MKKFDELFTFEYQFINYEEDKSDDHNIRMTFTPSKSETYADVVDKFLSFLSAAYGYPITLERLYWNNGIAQYDVSYDDVDAA